MGRRGAVLIVYREGRLVLKELHGIRMGVGNGIRRR